MGTTRAARGGGSAWSALDDDGFWEARDQNDDPNGTFGGRLERFERSLEALCVGFAEGRGEGGGGEGAAESRVGGGGGEEGAVDGEIVAEAARDDDGDGDDGDGARRRAHRRGENERRSDSAGRWVSMAQVRK